MKAHGSRSNLTAYPHSENSVRELLLNADIDIDSFKQNLLPCCPSNCLGMCCYDGVYVGDETAIKIEEVVKENKIFFQEIGLDLPESVITDGNWEGMKSDKKTAVKAKPFSSTVEGYPPHFEDTACVFLTNDGHCSLQALSVTKGFHPWYYKPFTCWLHPISISSEDDQVSILLHNPSNDPFKFPNYDGFVTKTFCGAVIEHGQSAYQVLSKELKFLGEIVGRNFLEEIQEKVATSI